MSEELELVLSTLKDQQEAISHLSKQQEQQAQKPSEGVMEQSGKLVKWIQGVIALVAIVLSVGVSYGVSTAKLSSLETANATLKGEIQKLEGKLEAHKEAEKTDKEKLETAVHELQLAQARDDQLFKSMDKSLEELKTDVKKLLRRRR